LFGLERISYQKNLFERVFVGLCRFDKAINAECRDDANGGEYNVLDCFHKVSPWLFYKDICFLEKGQ
jgi:hypothetical protein